MRILGLFLKHCLENSDGVQKHARTRINRGQSALNREGVVGILYRLAQRLDCVLGLALPHHEHSSRPLDVGVVRAQAFGSLYGFLGLLELGG